MRRRSVRLPTLYGIANIPELNKLFTTVAYNSGHVISMEALSKNSGISKATIGRYLEYLEAAFLIVRMRRVDETAKRLQRERNFKVFLSNPSMRAALFGPVTKDDPTMGALAETALVTQYLHAPLFRDLCFARWGQGEVDLVRVDPTSQRPLWALDAKWSDSACDSPGSWTGLLDFAGANKLDTVHMTSRSVTKTFTHGRFNHVVLALPMACFEIGRLAASTTDPQKLFHGVGGVREAGG